MLDDTNQSGSGMTPMQSGNYLSPQQQMQMNQYANSLMTNQGGTPANTLGSGLAEMGKAAIGGYLANQANPQAQQGNSIFSGLFPQQNGPTQLASANGGPASSIFSGLFGGSQPTS